MQVDWKDSHGALQNLERLQAGRADIALVQSGTHSILKPTVRFDRARFALNAYSEVTHFVVRRGAEIHSISDLWGKNVAMGQFDSGNYAMSRLILDHFDLRPRLKPFTGTYNQAHDRFVAGELDAALLTLGASSQAMEKLMATGCCELLPLPYARALSHSTVLVESRTIPAALYGAGHTASPPQDVPTLALRAQLLARDGLSPRLVHEAIRVFMSEGFQKANGLGELFHGKESFARSQPDFPAHAGALAYFESRTLLPKTYVELAKDLREVILSILLGLIAAVRWFMKQRELRREHRMDRFIQAVLNIERRQRVGDEIGRAHV